MQCPRCESTRVVKNGRIHSGKPKWMCKDCRRQFTLNPTNHRISDQTKALIDKLLLERLSLAAIVRVTGVSARWLQYYVNATYEAVPRSVSSTEKKRSVDNRMRRDMVVCGQQAAKKLDMAGARPSNT